MDESSSPEVPALLSESSRKEISWSDVEELIEFTRRVVYQREEIERHLRGKDDALQDARERIEELETAVEALARVCARGSAVGTRAKVVRGLAYVMGLSMAGFLHQFGGSLADHIVEPAQRAVQKVEVVCEVQITGDARTQLGARSTTRTRTNVSSEGTFEPVDTTAVRFGGQAPRVQEHHGGGGEARVTVSAHGQDTVPAPKEEVTATVRKDLNLRWGHEQATWGEEPMQVLEPGSIPSEHPQDSEGEV